MPAPPATLESTVAPDRMGVFIDRQAYLPEIDPRPVDFRAHCGPDRIQQWSTKACVAFAFCRAMQVWAKIHRAGEAWENPSPLFLWTVARQVYAPADPWRNIAVSLESAVSVVEQLGVPAESDWPWRLQAIHEEPSLAVLQRAFVHTAPGFARPIRKTGAARVAAVHAALQAGLPVVFSCGMRNAWIAYSMLNPLRHGRLDGHVDKPDFFHAMVIVGYDMSQHAFIVENWFGSAWGYRGFGYLSPGIIADGPSHGFWVVSNAPAWSR